MKLAIIGSRTFQDYDLLKKTIENFFAAIPINTIISGGAAGAGSLAKLYAVETGLNLVEHKAQWKIYGKSAGMRRNWDIVQSSDMVLAFWDGWSKGTQNTISLAKQAKKITLIVYF